MRNPETAESERVIRRRAIVRGRVQGVGFRAYTRAEAQRLQLTGWARNLPSGTVEVEAEGPAAAVAELLEWLRRGPPWAEVEGVDVDELEPLDDAGFRIH